MLRIALCFTAILAVASARAGQQASSQPAPQQAQTAQPVVIPSVIISIRDQKLMLLQNGYEVATYPVSTSKFGLGDNRGAMATPIGAMAVAQKIGDHAPPGAVFHNRRFTGEILQPNAPGRDPIVSRIIWLRGLEASTAHAFSRCIYIHGTAEERTIGTPASYGCIRMKSKDVIDLYSQLPLGSVVRVIADKMPNVAKAKVIYRFQAPDQPVEKGRPNAIAGSQKAKPLPKSASALRLARNNS
ncbi:MAG: L,D-transpeptidase [Verrucomicrobia bacterium]|nr:L,D-transpeptidase [Verrucomicrobiota bacterium]